MIKTTMKLEVYLAKGFPLDMGISNDACNIHIHTSAVNSYDETQVVIKYSYTIKYNSNIRTAFFIITQMHLIR